MGKIIFHKTVKLAKDSKPIEAPKKQENLQSSEESDRIAKINISKKIRELKRERSELDVNDVKYRSKKHAIDEKIKEFEEELESMTKSDNDEQEKEKENLGRNVIRINRNIRRIV